MKKALVMLLLFTFSEWQSSGNGRNMDLFTGIHIMVFQANFILMLLCQKKTFRHTRTVPAPLTFGAKGNHNYYLRFPLLH